jgi:hypothetical protein
VALRQRADVCVPVWPDGRALDLQHVLGCIARWEVEGTARRPAADALDRGAWREPPRGVLAVETDGTRIRAVMRPADWERATKSVKLDLGQ